MTEPTLTYNQRKSYRVDLTPDEIWEIRALYPAKPIDEISKEYNVSKVIIYKHCKGLLRYGSMHKRYDPTQIKKVKDQGFSFKQMMHLTGLSRSALQEYLKEPDMRRSAIKRAKRLKGKESTE